MIAWHRSVALALKDLMLLSMRPGCLHFRGRCYRRGFGLILSGPSSVNRNSRRSRRRGPHAGRGGSRAPRRRTSSKHSSKRTEAGSRAPRTTREFMLSQEGSRRIRAPFYVLRRPCARREPSRGEGGNMEGVLMNTAPGQQEVLSDPTRKRAWGNARDALPAAAAATGGGIDGSVLASWPSTCSANDDRFCTWQHRGRPPTGAGGRNCRS